jgi:hypothetical protein
MARLLFVLCLLGEPFEFPNAISDSRANAPLYSLPLYNRPSKCGLLQVGAGLDVLIAVSSPQVTVEHEMVHGGRSLGIPSSRPPFVGHLEWF